MEDTFQGLRLATTTGEQSYIKGNTKFFAVALTGNWMGLNVDHAMAFGLFLQTPLAILMACVVLRVPFHLAAVSSLAMLGILVLTLFGSDRARTARPPHDASSAAVATTAPPDEFCPDGAAMHERATDSKRRSISGAQRVKPLDLTARRAGVGARRWLSLCGSLRICRTCERERRRRDRGSGKTTMRCALSVVEKGEQPPAQYLA